MTGEFAGSIRDEVEVVWDGQLRATCAMSARQPAGIVVPVGDPYESVGQREN